MSAQIALRKTLRRVVYAVLFGVLVYGIFVVASGFQDISSSLSDFVWSALLLALGLASLNYACRFLKWQYYLRLLDIRGIGWLDSLLVFLSGFVLTITPGKVGEVFKSAVLHETHGIPPEQTAPIVVAERLTDVIGVVVLILVGSTSFEGGLYWAALGTLFVTLGLVAIFWERPATYLLSRLGRTWMVGLVPRLQTALQKLRRLSSLRALLVPSVLSVAAWALEGVALYVLLRGFGESVPVTLAAFFYATATLAGALTPLPGGLGVTEALIQQQLVHLASVSPSAATSSMLLVRLSTLWWAVAVGFVALLCLKLRHPQLLGKHDPGAIDG